MTLKEMREAAGYKSQDAAADASGLAQTTISNLEQGLGDMRLSSLEALATIYKRTLEEVSAAYKASPGEAA